MDDIWSIESIRVESRRNNMPTSEYNFAKCSPTDCALPASLSIAGNNILFEVHALHILLD